MADGADQKGAVLQISADLRRLEKAFEKASGTVDKSSTFMERRAKQMAQKVEASTGKVNVGKALDRVFDSTRLKVLDSGIARIGLFGSALEPLGPLGLAAAAGITAVSAAFVGAKAAAKYADDIADTANRLHITTDALQEYRYAIRAAGGEEKGADEALAAFSETLGNAHAGLKKAEGAFLRIGFKKEQIASMTDVESALQAVSEKLVGLSAADRDAAISKLGLGGLKELLDEGPAKITRLRDEAVKLGIVMDADLVKRGGELNDQFETVSKVIDVQLKMALVDLGPVLVGLLQQMAEMAKLAADVADAFKGIEGKRRSALEGQLADLQRQQKGERPQLTNIEKQSYKAGPLGVIGAGVNYAKRALKSPEKIQEEILSIQGELAKRTWEDLAKRPTVGTKSLIKAVSGGGGKTAPRDTTVQRTEQVEGQIYAAEQQVLQALLGLTTDVQARANLQKLIIDSELAQAGTRTAKQAADIEADKGLTEAKKKELILQLEVVDQKALDAAQLKKAAIDRETQAALDQEALNLKQARLAGEEELLQLQSSLTFSDAEHARIALRLVDLAYERERAELLAIEANEQVSAADREIARVKRQQLEQQQPGRRTEARRGGSEAARNAGNVARGVIDQGSAAENKRAELAEIQALLDEGVLAEQEAAQAKLQINAEYNAARLQSTSDMFGALAGLSESSNKTLAAIGKAAALTQATIDGVLAIQKAWASAPFPFNLPAVTATTVSTGINIAKIAGLKDGGPVSGPGGPRDDKVLRRLSNGEYVVNAKAAGTNRALLDHINAGGNARAFAPSFSVPRTGASQSIVNRGGDAHLTFAPNISNPDPDLARLLDTQSTAMLRFLKDAFRNNLLKQPGK